jgi:hypothetical protein
VEGGGEASPPRIPPVPARGGQAARRTASSASTVGGEPGVTKRSAPLGNRNRQTGPGSNGAPPSQPPPAGGRRAVPSPADETVHHWENRNRRTGPGTNGAPPSQPPPAGGRRAVPSPAGGGSGWGRSGTSRFQPRRAPEPWSRRVSEEGLQGFMPPPGEPAPPPRTSCQG